MASILLLESDPDVRRLLLLLLADLGHTAAAIELEQDVPAGTDLLLLDPTSRIHLEQARRARAENPALPVICMSFLQEEGRFLRTGPLVHLQKPFTADELDAAVRLALA
jgi:DNA-binding response OmpR family regulator